MTPPSTDAFILTRHAIDTARGMTFRYWAATPTGPVLIEVTGQEGVFFLPRTLPGEADRRASVELRTLDGASVDALYYRSSRALRKGRKSVVGACETDIRPADRYLMERFITGPVRIQGSPRKEKGYNRYLDPVVAPATYVPELRAASIDIETEGLDGALYSIAVRCGDVGLVFMAGVGDDTPTLHYRPDEKAVFESFLAWMQAADPDLLIGWNVIGFDLLFLADRCKTLQIPFILGRDGAHARIFPGERARQPARADVPGRMVIDGIPALRTAGYNFEDFSLEAVGQELLGRGKLIRPEDDRVAEINHLYQCDKPRLAAYNLQDCDLVLDIFAKTELVPFLIARATLTGLTMDRMPGSIAAFEFLYLPRLHRHGYVAPDVQEHPEANPNPGGYVLDSTPGLYENVLVFDFKSLYPSIIRTFHIDPLALNQPGEDPIPGFHGGAFSRDATILGGLIETLWAAREEAKRRGDRSLNLATKILMNAFYGVLGTPACRFYSPKLASSITRRSHEIMLRSKEQIEVAGHPVIYGDTDSLFVALGGRYAESEAHAVGRELALALNDWWRETLAREYQLPSFLELEFETCYLKFLMPTIRGSSKGTKKRYAGVQRLADGTLDVTFRGLESVRTDWTPLARTFQRELYRRVFLGEPFEDYVYETARDLLHGKLDDQVVYRKRLRKSIHEYTKNVPPQVQAARKIEGFLGSTVHYVITIHGPEPVQQRTSPIDYGHYLDHQLAPVADAILAFRGTSFEQIADPQLWLFEDTLLRPPEHKL